METMLQGLMDLSGVRATMVLDGAGRVVAHRGHAVYDRALCDEVGATVVKALESIQLQQEDWETLTAHFADGRLLVRRVAAQAGGPRHVLAVVADATLNASFATVALRVAANKVRGALDGAASQPGGPPAGSQAAAASSPGLSSSVTGPSESRPVLGHTGQSWSRTGAGSSAAGTSGLAVADAAASTFLARCAKELARHVGPMAKVYVAEAVRRLSPDAPFAVSLGRQLIDELAGQIEDQQDRTQFRGALLEQAKR